MEDIVHIMVKEKKSDSEQVMFFLSFVYFEVMC